MSAVVLKPAPKAEATALLLGFVSRFCYVKISRFGSFLSRNALPKIPANFAWTVAYGPTFEDLFCATFRNSGKKRFLAAILANTCLRSSQADLGLDTPSIFRVLHTLRSTKSTAASYTLNMASSLGAPPPPWCTALTLWPMICGGRRSGIC